jgi:hypothetical protein
MGLGWAWGSASGSTLAWELEQWVMVLVMVLGPLGWEWGMALGWAWATGLDWVWVKALGWVWGSVLGLALASE